MTARKTPPIEPQHAPAAPQPPLTFNDVMSAFAALQHPPEPPMQKAVLPVAIAIVIGLLGWVGTTLGSLSTTVAMMQPSLAIIQKSVDGLSVNQKDTQDKISEIQMHLGQHEMRLNAIEQIDTHMNDRLRIAEHQQPLHPDLQ